MCGAAGLDGVELPQTRRCWSVTTFSVTRAGVSVMTRSLKSWNITKLKKLPSDLPQFAVVTGRRYCASW